MQDKTYHILGLMSGSSLDGLDLAYCRFDLKDGAFKWEILHADTYAYSPKWRLRLERLPSQLALDFVKTHTYFGHYMGEMVNVFLEKHDVQPDFIASHGHTIYHYPDRLMTCQIGDGAALAVKTGYPVVCDFRTHDVALEGEGTPLAPAADRFLFADYDFFLNLGGIANISHKAGAEWSAYDVCPCNQVLNALANELGKEYDAGGELAREGCRISELYDFLNKYPYFSKPYPKSLDNGDIKRGFLPKVLMHQGEVADKLRTCSDVFAYQIARNIRGLAGGKGGKVLATGGGAYNAFLMDGIREGLGSGITMELPAPLIVEYKEALLMALMGLLRVENQANCFAEITGALSDSIGGAVYQGMGRAI